MTQATEVGKQAHVGRERAIPEGGAEEAASKRRHHSRDASVVE